MQELNVKLTHKTYPIYIENGLFEKVGETIQRLFPGRKIYVVTDSNIAPIYGTDLVEKLRKLNIQAMLHIIPAGEKSKSHNELLNLYTGFAGFGITRKDAIIALGGGVTGDLTGFAASTWLRGSGFIQIPTSLLAMVDSSIGGKVAVDLPAGKNLVGSFYHPEVVLIDPMLLKTLPDRHFSDGMAEIIKHGCILDKELFAMLENMESRQAVMEQIESIIYRNCNVKRQVVEQDEREGGLRMILNFGHTFGHAIEKVFHFERYTHGEAIAMGMAFTAELSLKLGYCTRSISHRIRALLERFHLPVDWPEMEPNQVQKAILLDKKAVTNELHLILIRDIGHVFIEKFPKDRIGGWIHENINH